MSEHDVLRLHAYADNELTAGEAIAFEAHLSGCAACRAELAQVRALKQALASAGLSELAPPHLAARIRRNLPSGQPWYRRLTAPVRNAPVWAGAIAATLVVAVVGATVLMRPPAITGDLVSSHRRALAAPQLVEVVSSERATLRPWLIGQLAFSPPVLPAADGCRLIGGRSDHVGSKPTAALAYICEGHKVSFFAQNVPDRAASTPPSVPRASTADGYQVVSWRRGHLNCFAVSDMDSKRLVSFARFIETHAAEG